MASPIRKKRLPHSVTYEEYVGRDTNGRKPTYNAGVTLTRVKIDDKIKTAIDNNGIELHGEAMMFYDIVNSSGTSDFVNGSKITFKGRTYKISYVEPLYNDDDTIHHFEVLLV